MALVTRILLVTCLVLAAQGEDLFELIPHKENSTKLDDINLSSKDVANIIQAAMTKQGVHFGTNDKIALAKSPEKVAGVDIEDIAAGGVSKHAVQKPGHIRFNNFRSLLGAKRPVFSKDRIVDMKKSKDYKFIVNNKKTTNFEVSTIKNEIYGRGNIRLQGKSEGASQPSNGMYDEFIRKKESEIRTGSDNAPTISMNVHNLNAPNEGLIYMNSPVPAAVKAERIPANYILVNVSGEPALIPSVLLGKSGLIPKDKIINNTDISGFPFFNFWPKHQVEIPKNNILNDNDAVLENFKCNKTHPELLKDKLKHLEAIIKEGLPIPKLNDGSYDWDKITSHVIKVRPEMIPTTKRPEVTTKKVDLLNIRKQYLLAQLQKYGIRIPKKLDGSVDWDQVGVILRKLEYDSTTKAPVVLTTTKKPIVITTKKPNLLETHKRFMLKEHAKLGIPLPIKDDGSINWNLVVKHLIDAQATTKKPEIIITTTEKPEFDIKKNIVLAKLTNTTPKVPVESIDWDNVKGDLVDVTPKPKLTPEEQKISDLYAKLGLELPKKPSGDIDWDAAYNYLASLQKETKEPDNKENDKINILQQLDNLGIPVPKKPNGDIDWQAINYILKNGGTTERPIIETPITESPKGVIVLGKTDLLTTFKKLGLPIPTKADGTPDWDAIIKYLIEHGYKVETGEISGGGAGLGDLLNMSVGDRLDLLNRLQNLGLPIPKLPNGKIDWASIYQYLLSNGYNLNNAVASGGLNIKDLGVMDRIKLLEKMKNSGVPVPKLPNGQINWGAVSKYFGKNDVSSDLDLINKMSPRDRQNLLQKLKGYGIPLYWLSNGNYDWRRILQAARQKGVKLTGELITINETTTDIGSVLSSDDKMKLLGEITRLRLPVPKLPGGGLDWNAIVSEIKKAKIRPVIRPGGSGGGLLGLVTNILG